MSEGLNPALTPLGPFDEFAALAEFRCLQYSLFVTIFVEVIGGFFFLLTALHIEKDKAVVDLTLAGE